MGNLNDMDFGGAGPPVPPDELEKLRAFRLAVSAEISTLETHATRMIQAFPKTCESLVRLIAAFRASE